VNLPVLRLIAGPKEKPLSFLDPFEDFDEATR